MPLGFGRGGQGLVGADTSPLARGWPPMRARSAGALCRRCPDSTARKKSCYPPVSKRNSAAPSSAASQTSDSATPEAEAQPKTLEMATAAVQEWADRRSSEDYAGAWQLFNKQVQDGMSEADYVTLSETCTSALTKYPETAKRRTDGRSR